MLENTLRTKLSWHNVNRFNTFEVLKQFRTFFLLVKRVLLILFCLLAVRGIAQELAFPARYLLQPSYYGDELSASFEISRTGSFNPQPVPHKALLEFGYANSFIENDSFWTALKDSVKVDTIRIVFTMYPNNPEFWLTNYHTLLARRMRNLFYLDPKLNLETIHFEMVLQTDCEDELTAMSLFHGFEVIYHPIEPKRDTAERAVDEDSLAYYSPAPVSDSLRNDPGYLELIRFMNDQRGAKDTTVHYVLNRHPEWQDALVVLDWTGSMYHHGAMSILWNIEQLDAATIRYFTLFNDGNGKSRKRKKVGKTGGIYHTDYAPPLDMLPTLLKVQQKGRGGDAPENDVEAIVKGLKKFKDARHVILVADNASCIRDLSLYQTLDTPVHIIIPGEYAMINHQYINLAYKTNGSIHTFENDYYTFERGSAPKEVTINNYDYILNRYDFYQSVAPIGYSYCYNFYDIENYSRMVKTIRKALSQVN